MGFLITFLEPFVGTYSGLHFSILICGIIVFQPRIFTFNHPHLWPLRRILLLIALVAVWVKLPASTLPRLPATTRELESNFHCILQWHSGWINHVISSGYFGNLEICKTKVCTTMKERLPVASSLCAVFFSFQVWCLVILSYSRFAITWRWLFGRYSHRQCARYHLVNYMTMFTIPTGLIFWTTSGAFFFR